MTIKFVASASLATIALLATQSLVQGLTAEAGWAKPSGVAAPTPILTTFHCVRAGDAYATVARRGDRQTPPMIMWRSTLGEYGQYTPQRRCQIVSDKFTRAVVLNGGKLGGMSLTYGVNNRQRVICYVNHYRDSCNSENQLFTLRPSDYGRERQILEQLVNFSAKGSGTPVQQSGEIFYADLGDSIERFFSTNNTQTPTSTPSTRSLPTPKPLVPFKNPTTSKDNSI